MIPAPSADALAPLRLLLVEDNPGDAVLVREMLRDALSDGFELVQVDDLQHACSELEATGAECVLLDLSLPDASGLEAVTRIQASSPDVPIVVLTGLDDERLALNAVQEGAQDYLIKGRIDQLLIARSIRYAIERKRAEVALSHQALHDSLTGLPNRTLFLDRLEQALARALRHPSTVAVLFLDLDRFKVINDSLGHDCGDRLLVDVAERLRGLLRPGDTVARFGGDEFTILCDEIAGERDAVAIAERVHEAVSLPFPIEDGEAFLTASVGIAMSMDDSSGPETLIRDADAAMYRAKERGKPHELFDAAMRERAIERLETENALHRAIERGELRVHYQPIVELGSGLIVGVEALARWEHPTRGLIYPEAFIALAEKTGQIVELGAWVLREACAQAARWSTLASTPAPLRMSVNLSARQLAQADLVKTVADVLSETQMPPADLCLEITESVVVEDAEGSLAAVRALKSQGVLIGIDDFGTGWASLSMLKRVPADVIKIDQSFVGGLGDPGHDAPIISAVLGLAAALDLTAIAEGVETAEQAAELQSIGCRVAQGFYFARPQPAEQITAMLLRGPHLAPVH